MSRLAWVRAHGLSLLGLGIASTGFVLESPVGMLAAFLLALSVWLAPAPLGVAFGHVALAAVMDVTLGVRVVLVEVGLLTILLGDLPIDAATGRWSTLVAGGVVGVLVVAYSWGVQLGSARWLLGAGVLASMGIGLYAVHRYELVTLGLVEQ